MSPLATIIYEDQMLPGPGAHYPIHDFVMRLVEDDINGETWRLHSQIEKNPKKGIGNILRDLRITDLIAGAGQLYLLIDRDVIAHQLNLQAKASDTDIIKQLKAKSDAPEKLFPFFLEPNVEGLIRTIESCDPHLLPENVCRALQKKIQDRDIVINEAKKATRRTLRECIRSKQPGLDALAKAIGGLIRI